MVTDTWAAAGVVTTTAGAEAVVIITDGPGAAVTAITDKPSLDSRSPFHCPGERELQRQERVAPRGAAGSASQTPMALSRAPSPPRSGSDPSGSWRRASA